MNAGRNYNGPMVERCHSESTLTQVREPLFSFLVQLRKTEMKKN